MIHTKLAQSKCFYLLAMMLSLSATDFALAGDNPWASPGEVVRYHYIDTAGNSIDMSFWPVSDKLTKQLYIANNETYYENFVYTKQLTNVRGTSFGDIGADFFIVLFGCRKNGAVLSEAQCLKEEGTAYTIIRRGLAGAYSVSPQAEPKRKTMHGLFTRPARGLNISKLEFFERNIETIKATSSEASAFAERGKRIHAQAEKRAREAAAAAEKARLARLRAQREKESQRRKAALAREGSGDREPTQAEMNRAIRSTVAGALFNASVTKLGGCRKAAPYDYYCRYRLFSVNWGNFWKANGRWYFKIAN